MITALVVAALLADVAPRGLSDQVLGTERTHVVAPGEWLWFLSARYGIEAATLARDNGLKPNARLAPGTALRVDAWHVAPRPAADGILINIPQRMLFLWQGGALAAAYPVGLGRPDWRTPTGRYRVLVKEENPTWDVPVSIQEEMRREGKPVRTKVPPCPENPLGAFWLGLSAPNLGIHATIAPASIYRFVTHGCVRMQSADVADLYPRVSVGTPVEILYEPVLVAATPDGRVFVESHRDVYRHAGDPEPRLRALLKTGGLAERVEWDAARGVLRAREGVAREIPRR